MPELYPEDQQKVDKFLSANVNDVERAPFRPLLLLGVIVFVLALLTLVSFFVAFGHGVV